MPTMQDVIRRVQIQASQQGAEQTTASLQKLAGAQDAVAVATTNTERATISMQGKLNSLMKTLDAEYASEQKLAAVEKTLTAARDQGLISIQRENELLGAAKLKYTEAGEAAKVMQERLATAKEIALGFAGAIGAGFAFGGLAELPAKFKETIEAAAGLKDMAETIGITADNLQKLDYAASQNGVSTETMNSALAKFSKNLGEASTGTGQLYKILQANHVVISGDVTKDFENYASLIQNASNAEQKNVLVAAAFGKGAAEMGNIFNDGAAGVRKLADEADKAGVIMGDSTLTNAKELDDEMAKLTIQFNSTFSDFALLTAPLVIKAMEDISASIRDIKTVVDELSQGNALQIIADIEKGKLDGAANLAGKIANAVNPGAAIASPLTNWINSSFKNGAANDSAPSSRVHDFDVDPDLPKAVVHGATVIPQAPDSAAVKQASEIQRVTDALNLQIKNLTETNRQQEINNELAKAHVTAASKEGQAIADLAGKYYDEKKAIDDANQAASFFAQTTESALQSVLDGSSSVVDAMLNVAKAIAEAALQAELLGSGPLAGILGTSPTTSGGVGGILGSLFSSLIPHADGGVHTSPSLSAYSNTIVDKPTFFKFANGGVMSEAGPEAIMPLRRGPDGRLGVAASNSNGGNHVHVTVGVDTDSQGNITPYVTSVVMNGIEQYDRAMPHRIRQITNDPRAA